MDAVQKIATPGPYQVVTTAAHKRGAGLILGVVTKKADGWKFIPHFQASPSRRGWPTPYEALDGRVSNYTLVSARAAVAEMAQP